MQFKRDTVVASANGKEVGHVDRIALDSTTKAVTHVVVRQGFFLPQARVVPLDLIETASAGGIQLKEQAGDLHELPVFDEVHFVEATEPATTDTANDSREETAPPFFWYPMFDGLPPRMTFDPAVPGLIAETDKHIPAGTVAVREGAEVIAADGKNVGTLEQVCTDAHSDRAEQLVVAQGLLIKERRLVPMTWVDGLKEDEIHLAVASHTVDELGFIPPEI